MTLCSPTPLEGFASLPVRGHPTTLKERSVVVAEEKVGDLCPSARHSEVLLEPWWFSAIKATQWSTAGLGRQFLKPEHGHRRAGPSVCFTPGVQVEVTLCRLGSPEGGGRRTAARADPPAATRRWHAVAVLSSQEAAEAWNVGRTSTDPHWSSASATTRQKQRRYWLLTETQTCWRRWGRRVPKHSRRGGQVGTTNGMRQKPRYAALSHPFAKDLSATPPLTPE